MSLGAIPNLHKDQYLISVIPWWSTSDSTVSFEELLESIEASGRIGHRSENDQGEIEILRLTGSAK